MTGTKPPRLVAGPPRASARPSWWPKQWERAWTAGQRPILWHTPSRTVLIIGLLAVGALSAVRAIAGLAASPAVDVILGSAAAGLLWLIVRAGKRMSLTALGWVHFASGARYGAAFAGLVLAGTSVALLIPDIRLAVRIDAPDNVPSSFWAFAAIALVPLSTVLFEELLFRGVLLAWLRIRLRDVWAVVVSSLAFGAWHLPALVFTDTAALSDAPLAVQMAGTFTVTAMAGVIFAILRLRSRSLLAPMIAHTATNSIGFVALILAWSPWY